MNAIDYFAGDELPASVWSEKYALRDRDDNVIESSPDDMHWRLAREFARIEKKKFKKPYTAEFLYDLFRDFGSLIPQGSPMYGIGNPQYVSLSNCFVVTPPTDSYGGIMLTDEQMAQLCKRRGGVGTDISEIRPDSMPTTNSARRATGILPFMERFSNTIREVGQNGRRGALMLTLSVHHPQVLDFARVKLDPTKVTGANVSIRLTDEFLKAVEADTDYEQRWPVEGAPPQITRRVRAREIWTEIVRCAHARAEPGLLFWDQILRESPADCYEQFKTRSTNPCAEIALSLLDSCRLLVINYFSCVVDPFKKNARFDYKRLFELAYIGQRLMDDLVDLEIECVDRILAKIASDPEPEQTKATERNTWEAIKQAAVQGRRTGLGPTAIGDTLAALGVGYGSEQSVEIVDKLYRTMKLGAYRASVDMAKEIGPFPVWSAEKETGCPFLLRIKDEDPTLYVDMQKYGRRNIALLTTAPTGSVSILTGPRPYFGKTSGFEPLFRDKPYTRRKKVNHAEKDAKTDFVDKLGDRWTEYPVFHSMIKMWMDVTGETDWQKSPYHGYCAEDIDWQMRVRLQAAAQKHVDHAISSTVNLPNSVTVEKVAEIYETAWRAGCKGITVYRDGCRDGVLVDAKQPTEVKTAISQTTAPKRPAALLCDVHHTSVKGQKCVVFVGLLDGVPYEAFATLDAGDRKFASTGVLKKVSRGQYVWQGEDEDDFVLSTKLTDEQAAVTRLVSTSLRHGTPVAFVVHQLEKVKGDLNGFAKAMARVLKKYVKDGTTVCGEQCGRCGSDEMVRQEGCVTCRACGWSKCN